MRLDFNVLWVDDQPNHVEAQIKRIEKRMEEEGFRFNPWLAQSVDEVHQRIGESVFTDEIDLVLVDWDLGIQGQGQYVIADIRRVVPYKDVVFYSAQTPASRLRQLAFEREVEGIYCASREDLVEEVLGVFESLVKKVLDLDHARGIVMSATSDIDYMVIECLFAIHEHFDEDGRAAMLRRTMEHVEKGVNYRSQAAAKLKGITSLPEILGAHQILTSYDRLSLLADFLNLKFLEPHQAFRQFVVTYQQQVVPKRNKMGHLVLRPEGKNLVDDKGKVFSLEETRQLRRLILTLRGEFRKLLQSLQGSVTNTATPSLGTQEVL